MRINLDISYEVEDDDDEKVAIAKEIVERQAIRFAQDLRDTLVDHGLEIEDFNVGSAKT